VKIRTITKQALKALTLLLTSTLFFSCVHKKCSQESVTCAQRIPLSLEMPQNKLVFKNLSALVYDSLWDHFQGVGFRMTDGKQDSYLLRVTIKNEDASFKFLSPDLLMYAVNMKLELHCRLFDRDRKLCAQKTFRFHTFLHKPKRYVEHSAFVDFEYRRMLRSGVHKIDQYFRRYFTRDA